MTSFFPDLNVWLALSFAEHVHNPVAWRWFDELPEDASLLFCRFTQLGLLRLLTNPAAIGSYARSLESAWEIYDRWLADPRVQFHPEPRGLDPAFRQASAPFSSQRASKWIGDCYLLAFARESGATLITFDQALLALARKQHSPPSSPAPPRPRQCGD
jgi:uncharacterized protein